MNLRFVNKSSKKALAIYPVFEKELVKPAFLQRLVKQLAESKEFEPKSGKVFFHWKDRLLFLGLGNAKKLNVSEVMEAFGGAVAAAKGHHPEILSIMLSVPLQPFAQAIVETAALADYNPSATYKTGKSLREIKEQRIKNVEIITSSRDKKLMAACKRGLLVAGVTNEVREWVNAPPNIANAKFFEEEARKISKETGATLTILKKKELEKLRMGALLGVNKGSPDEAMLIVLDYNPAGSPKEPPIAFVGKGILFDSGGYNLKPSGHIEDMQLDKAGAASVLAIIKLAKRLGILRHIVAVLPFTENLIGPHAQKPSEIVRTYSGKTIEITNTDAEGRLILADAVAYTVDKFKPKFLIDLATLTGACVVALGHRYAGLFGNDKELQENLQKAGDETDELLWPLPIHKDYEEKIKGYYADICNADTGTERGAGASKGAAFIKEFVGKTKWVHLDIAGPAFVKEPKTYEAKGATGFGVRLLARFLERLNDIRLTTSK